VLSSQEPAQGRTFVPMAPKEARSRSDETVCEWGAALQFSPLGSRGINSQIVLKTARLTMRILKAADRAVTVPPAAECTVNGLDELKDCLYHVNLIVQKAMADPHR
jgi:hypothetical protein